MDSLRPSRPARRSARRLVPATVACAALALAPLADASDPPACAGRPATIVGTGDNDDLEGTIRDDVIWAGAGNDRIEAGPGDDVVCAGPGDDLVVGEGGRDTLLGGGGADVMDGGSGNDSLAGGPGADHLLGGMGDDRVAGAQGDDTLAGGPGADTLNGGPGADQMEGGDGPDRLFAGDGADHLAGGRGDDLLQGGRGADHLAGGDDHDALSGGEDDDTVEGGNGIDTCDGGPGRDSAATCEQVRATEEGQVPRPLTRPGPHQVALTFDDGPAYAYTRQILDILARYDVPATFFIIGRHAADQPDMLRRIVAEGHSVQNHTYGHYRLTRYSDATITEQFESTNRVIQAAGGASPHCMRPPFGAVDDRVRSVAAGLGLATIMWDVDPADWSKPGAGAVASRVLRHADGGDIVVLHDIAGWSTIGALPAIIEGLRARGLEFVPLCSIPGLAPRQAGDDGRLQFVGAL
ncbi:MAG: polysaccharide deacetylase family protein [Actinomycetota bacterium]